MPFTDAPGFRMYYEVHGDGFPLLLINGLGGDHTEWLIQLPEFSRLFKVVTFDNRGAGDSEAPPGPYSTAQMADDATALLSFLGISRTHVLGFSMGGMIAQEVALRHPEIVARLILACTSPGGKGSERPAFEAIGSFACSSEADPEEQFRRLIPFLYTDRFCRDYPEEIDKAVRRRLSRPVSLPGQASQMAAAMGHGAWERLPAIAAPTLVLTGTADRLVPQVNSQRIAERIPGAKLVFLDGAPHRLFAEDAEAFHREVLAFLLDDSNR
ncbi:MAG: alpha/beta fold hydrolase [Candidatus Deferrimicrobiaceae bacterium]